MFAQFIDFILLLSVIVKFIGGYDRNFAISEKSIFFVNKIYKLICANINTKIMIIMKHLFKILLVLMTLNCCTSKTKILTKTEFTLIYFDSLKLRLPEVDFKIISDLTITSSFDEKEFKHILDNAYQEYKLQTSSINAIITNHINASSELYLDKKNIKVERIVPVIKSKDYLDKVNQLTEQQESNIVYEKYNDQLIIVYCEDTEYGISYFDKDHFQQLGINTDTLLAFSISNLKRLLPDIQSIGENGNFGIIAGGNYEASLILFQNMWTKENFDVKGDFVIAIPNRDVLLITGSTNIEEVQKIKELAEKSYKEGTYNISPYLYKWNGKIFEKYK
ncbi:MAG: DUF1444 family protein [Prevotellaceae bacterium]|jgi:uncharacterized protein YtpQ (UPF0354 family)|nr:DUF1444 family protein [Prevotellaceae bacterium]